MIKRWRPYWARRWQPFRGMSNEEMKRFLEESPVSWHPWARHARTVREWSLRLDMFDCGDRVIVKAELPGVDKDDIDISVVGDVLTIKGQQKPEEEIKDEDYYCRERYRGSFHRTIQLPAEVDIEKIAARCENGVLEITLPKSPEVTPKKISVSVK